MRNPLLPVFAPDTRLRRFRLWLTLGCMFIAAIIWLSLTSVPPVAMPGHSDKIYHLISYAGLMLWWLQLFPRLAARVVLALAFIGLGASMEFVQSFHPLRYLDFGDMTANAAGVLVALGLGFTALQRALLWFEGKVAGSR